jgi:hypothetical protein
MSTKIRFTLLLLIFLLFIALLFIEVINPIIDIEKVKITTCGGKKPF